VRGAPDNSSTAAVAPLSSSNIAPNETAHPSHSAPSSQLLPASSSHSSASAFTAATSSSAALPSASASALSIADSLAALYDFKPDYKLEDHATFDPEDILSAETWKARQMPAWTRFYIDSFYHPDAVDGQGNHLGFLDQLLNQPEIRWRSAYCTIDSNHATCGVMGAYNRLHEHAHGA
jgi:hypothetical protein